MTVIRYILGALLAFLAFNAFGGGIYGMAGAVGFPTEWLAGSPFGSYFVPGLVLFVVVGGTCMAAAIAVFDAKPRAPFLAAGAAVIVACWICAQVAIIGLVSWLQPATLAVALVVALLAWEVAPASAFPARRPLARANRAHSS